MNNTIDYEKTIRQSNTIFSSMVCPKCGTRLQFHPYSDSKLEVYCPVDVKHKDFNISISEMCSLINNNGLNQFITPLSNKSSKYKTSDNSIQEVPPPPEGFKIEAEFDKDK